MVIMRRQTMRKHVIMLILMLSLYWNYILIWGMLGLLLAKSLLNIWVLLLPKGNSSIMENGRNSIILTNSSNAISAANHKFNQDW